MRLWPQSCPQTSHDESRHTSVETLMWRWTLCYDFFWTHSTFWTIQVNTKIALQNACKRRLCIDMRALPVLYRVGIAKTMFWRLKQGLTQLLELLPLSVRICTFVRHPLFLAPARWAGANKNYRGNKNFPKKHFEGELRPCLAFVNPCQGITIVFLYPSTRIDEMTN